MQPELDQGPSAKHVLKQLTHLLTLTNDQQAQVKALLTDQQKQIEALSKRTQSARDNNDGGPSQVTMMAARDEAKSIREDTYTKIAAVLTADQQTKFATWKEKQEKAAERQNQDMPPGGGGPPGGGPPGV
jgi:Spy/CpxP family protein refolding chaperone